MRTFLPSSARSSWSLLSGRAFAASATSHGAAMPNAWRCRMQPPPASSLVAAAVAPRRRPSLLSSPSPSSSPSRPSTTTRTAALPDAGSLTPLALFLTPGALMLVWATYLGKGNLGDGLSKALTLVSQGYFQPDVGGENIPSATGELSDLAGDEPLFKALYQWFIDNGGVFKLAFGPKAFIVVSDPVVARHLLKENAFNYDKGVLAEILEPIMGKGLIPADLETWKPRRRAIVPAFHQAWLGAMTRMFGRVALASASNISRAIDESASASGKGEAVVDMEAAFLSFGLDVIGLGVFNFDFGSVTAESPVIKSVYGVLKEAEHRSTFYIPYWNLPLSSVLVPRQRRFRADLAVINACLDDLIEGARATRDEQEPEALASRDYGTEVSDPSLLRFLVDARGADLGDRQLRDDLMTMLIAGHETTAAVLTWALFSLVENPEKMKKAVAEVDAAVGDAPPATVEDVGRKLPYIRACLAESLRLYPQPPILIRRALSDDVLPAGLNGDPTGYPIGAGADLFISVYNLHRSPHLWSEPDAFVPERYDEKFENPGFNGKWAGYDPSALSPSAMYPNEVSSDFAFIPFGGGARKCVGDQFAVVEAAVMLAVLLRRFEFSFPTDGPGAKGVGMATGATIHTANGLNLAVRRRAGVEVDEVAAARAVAKNVKEQEEEKAEVKA